MSTNAELLTMVGSLVKSGAVASLDVKADGSVHMDFRQMEASNDAHVHAPAANQSQFAVAGLSTPPAQKIKHDHLQNQMDAMVKAGLMDASHQQAMNAVLQQQGVEMPAASAQHAHKEIVGHHTNQLAAANAAQYQKAVNGPAL
jgi:hypothetical protein